MKDSARSIHTDRRGASEVLGVVLLLFMVFAAAGLLVVAGDAAIDGAKSSAELESTTLEMQQVNQQLNDVAYGPPERTSEVDLGSARVDGEATISVEVNDNATRSSSVTIRTLRARLDSGEVVTVENGGVWRRTESGTELVAAPAVELRDGVLSLRVIDVEDAGGATSGELTARRDLEASQQRTEQIYDDLFGYRSADELDNLTITVESDHYDAWADYLEAETGATPAVHDDRNAVSVTLDDRHIDTTPSGSDGGDADDGADDDTGDDSDDTGDDGSEESPYDCTDESGGPAHDGENGCRPLRADGDELVVNESTGTLRLLEPQVGTTVERSATRDPIDVNFVIDASGSNDYGPESYEGRADGVVDWWGEYRYTDDADGYLVPRRESFRDFALVREGGEWVPIQNAESVAVERRHGRNLYRTAPDAQIRIVRGWDVEGKRVDATRDFVDQLRPREYGDRAGVVEFDTRAALRHGLSTDHESVKRSITGEAAGGTNIGAGMQRAIDEFDRAGRAEAEDIVVVLTDGYNNAAGADDDTREAIRRARERGITVYTVGFGAADADAENVRLLRRAADRTGGEYYNAGEADRLEATFAEIADDVTEETERVRTNPSSVEVALGGETYYLQDNGNNQKLKKPNRPLGSNPNLDVNRVENRDPSTFALDRQLSVGDRLALSAMTWDCADPESAGESRGEYELVSCDYPRNGDRTTHDGSVEVFTDGDAVPEWATEPWQRDVAAVVGDERVRAGPDGRVFDLTDRQAVVLIRTPIDGDAGYLPLLFEAGESDETTDDEDEADGGDDAEADAREPAIPDGFDLRVAHTELDG